MPMPNLQENIGGNTPLIDDDTIKNIINRLRGLLDEEIFEKVEGALLGMADMSMDRGCKGAIDEEALKGLSGKARDIELAGQAMAILRRNDIPQAMIDKILLKDFGVGPAALAQDSARRERNRERDAENYRKMFPNAPQNSGEATAPRQRERYARDPESYARMFPEAQRLG